MTPAKASLGARRGELLPVYVLSGEERFLRDRLVAELRAAALGQGPAAFNEDRFTAGESDVGKVLSALRTVPMMSPKRFVLVRSVERWEGRAEGAESSASSETSPLDQLAKYAEAPIDSTCLVLVTEKLDGRRKLSVLAKKKDFLVECAPLSDEGLVQFTEQAIQERGHPVGGEVAEHIARLAGPDIASVADAVERLSLFVGPTQPITDEAVAECVARLRTEDTWALVDAVGERNAGRALTLMGDVFDARDRGLPLVGALAWSFRQLLRLKLALANGLRVDEAGRRAGIFGPGRAETLSKRAAQIPEVEVERWLSVLARADMELKSSRRPPRATLESALLEIALPPGKKARVS